MSGTQPHRKRSHAPAVVAVLGCLAIGVAAWAQLIPARSPGPAGFGSTFPGSSGLSADTASPSASPFTTTEPSPWPSSSLAPSPAPVPTPVRPLAKGIVPILYLHRVQAVPAAWSSWTVTERHRFLAYDVLPDAFAADLDWLRANGYTTILPRDLAAHWDHGAPLPPRPVIITLDDGWPSWTRTVLPMLQSRGMVAEFYLTVDAVTRGTITWADVRQLAAAGMGIGAHDVHHVQLAGLGAGQPPASAAEMWYEIDQARLTIGRELGQLPDSMAYVGGGFNAELMALAQRAGYTTARSIDRGIRQDRSDRYALRVISIGSCDDVLDVVTERLTPGLPVFSAKMAGRTTGNRACPAPMAPPMDWTEAAE